MTLSITCESIRFLTTPVRCSTSDSRGGRRRGPAHNTSSCGPGPAGGGAPHNTAAPSGRTTSGHSAVACRDVP